MAPSKDVADSLMGVVIACAESARSDASADVPRKLRTEAWKQRHQEQVQRFLNWCGDLQALRLAQADAERNSRLAGPGTSDQDRARASLDASGHIAPERQEDALALLLETESLAVADGLALEFYGLATMASAESALRVRNDDEVRQFRVAYLASAMVYCRNAALCASDHPRTMLDCANSGLCAPNQSLLDLRYALANRFEREMAEWMVAEWRHRRRAKPPGS